MDLNRRSRVLGGRVAFLWWAFASGASALAGIAADDKVDEDLRQFPGVWAFESREVGGQQEPAEQLEPMRIAFAGGKVILKRGDELVFAGPQKLDPSTTPKAVDCTVTEGLGKGNVTLGIYEFDGDTLKVCFAPEGKARPTEFKTAAGTGTFLNVHRRAKT